MNGWDIAIGAVQFIKVWCELAMIALILVMLVRMILDPILESLNVSWRESFKQFTNGNMFLVFVSVFCLLITMMLKIAGLI